MLLKEKLRLLSKTTLNPETNEPYTVPEILVATKISNATWYRYLDGTIPNTKNLSAIAELFNVSVDYLLDENKGAEINSTESIVEDILLRSNSQNQHQRLQDIIIHLTKKLQDFEEK